MVAEEDASGSSAVLSPVWEDASALAALDGSGVELACPEAGWAGWLQLESSSVKAKSHTIFFIFKSPFQGYFFRGHSPPHL